MLETGLRNIGVYFFTSLLVVAFLTCEHNWAQTSNDPTVGLIMKDTLAFEGYTLFAPIVSNTTYLIDNDGLLVHSWESSFKPGQSAYLLEDGSLLRTKNVRNNLFDAGGTGGGVQIYEWDGTLVWDINYSSTELCQHHDIEILPNGNVLIIAWELKTESEAIAAGRNTNLLKEGSLWPDYIVEVKPDGATGGIII